MKCGFGSDPGHSVFRHDVGPILPARIEQEQMNRYAIGQCIQHLQVEKGQIGNAEYRYPVRKVRHIPALVFQDADQFFLQIGAMQLPGPGSQRPP